MTTQKINEAVSLARKATAFTVSGDGYVEPPFLKDYRIMSEGILSLHEQVKELQKEIEDAPVVYSFEKFEHSWLEGNPVLGLESKTQPTHKAKLVRVEPI